jgi:hypothetical protein
MSDFQNKTDKELVVLSLEDSDVFYHRKNNSLSKLYIFSLTSDEDHRIKNYISAQFNKCLQTQISNIN